MKLAKIIIVSIIFIAAISFVAMRYIGDSMDGLSMCGEDIVSQISSPNGVVARVYLRNCGATTGYVTHVNLSEKNQDPQPNNSGVIMGGEVLKYPGKADIKLSWLSPTELEIDISDYESSNLSHSKSWGSVKISVK